MRGSAARTVIVMSGQYGGMAATDGPVPVRTLAHAARLLHDADNSASTASSSVNPRSTTNGS